MSISRSSLRGTHDLKNLCARTWANNGFTKHKLSPCAAVALPSVLPSVCLVSPCPCMLPAHLVRFTLYSAISVSLLPCVLQHPCALPSPCVVAAGCAAAVVRAAAVPFVQPPCRVCCRPTLCAAAVPHLRCHQCAVADVYANKVKRETPGIHSCSGQSGLWCLVPPR